ncbi:hypothetical protein TNCV_3939501 [Trichonephila clavipes]|uniref:Uncharacterized protein n=1 Tax=Trichonephila clavipes TaxID=2585209 RepID=A0A8X7B9R3_TRICX|nr:hypothetical protein TNCV_3939501 [Trichonephila clavipes]
MRRNNAKQRCEGNFRPPSKQPGSHTKGLSLFKHLKLWDDIEVRFVVARWLKPQVVFDESILTLVERNSDATEKEITMMEGETVMLMSPSTATPGQLATELVVANLGQVTRTTLELGALL